MNIEKYLEQALKRTNLQEIISFLFYGVESIEIDTRSYDERLKQESQPMINRLKKIYPDEEEYEKVTGEFYSAASEYQNVGIEIGMILGAKLLHNLLFHED